MILNQMRRTVAVYNPNRAPLDYSATLYHPLEAIVIPTRANSSVRKLRIRQRAIKDYAALACGCVKTKMTHGYHSLGGLGRR
jgi:hypothetical protein